MLQPRPAFDSSEWNIIATVDGLSADAFDPFMWIGIQDLPLCPPSPPPFPFIQLPGECDLSALNNHCFEPLDPEDPDVFDNCSCETSCTLAPGTCCEDFTFT